MRVFTVGLYIVSSADLAFSAPYFLNVRKLQDFMPLSIEFTACHKPIHFSTDPQSKQRLLYLREVLTFLYIYTQKPGASTFPAGRRWWTSGGWQGASAQRLGAPAQGDRSERFRQGQLLTTRSASSTSLAPGTGGSHELAGFGYAVVLAASAWEFSRGEG